MAEAQAGQSNAQEQPNADATVTPGAEPEGDGAQPVKTYTQADLDRITAKVRKNAARDTELRFRRDQEARQQAGASAGKEPGDKPEPSKPAEKAEPKREDFQTFEEFIEARADFRARKAVREEREAVEKESKTRQETEANETRARTFKGRVEQLAKEIPDFEEVIADAHDVYLSKAMSEVIQESDHGPRMLYELVKNRQEMERIAKLPPLAQQREMFKLEAKYEAAAKKPGKEGDDNADGSDDETGGEDADEEQPGFDAESKGEDRERSADGTFKSPKKKPAPDPIEPGGARRADTSTRPSDKDDMATWIRKREAEVKRVGGK